MEILNIDLYLVIKMLKNTFRKNGVKILPIMQCKVINRKLGKNHH